MKRNHSQTDIIKENLNKPFPVMNQFKKGVDINRVFKKADIPQIAKKASKNCKFSAKYIEEMTNSSSINTSATTQLPEYNKVIQKKNYFFPDECLNDDDLISNQQQYLSNNYEEIWSDSMIAKNLEETIISVQKEIDTLEKRDFDCLFNDEDHDLDSKFSKIDYSGPNFGFCIGEKSPAFIKAQGINVKKLKNYSNINKGCFFEDDCLSFKDDSEELSSPIHKLSSKKNISYALENDLF